MVLGRVYWEVSENEMVENALAILRSIIINKS